MTIEFVLRLQKKRPATTSKIDLQDSSSSTKPAMMPSKKARLPKLVERHPFYPDQYSKLNKTRKDFTKPSMPNLFLQRDQEG